MKTYFKCLDCCFHSYIEQLDRFEIDPSVAEDMTRAFLRYLSDMDYSSQTPPYIARFLQNMVREKTGIDDPYADMKKLYNGKMVKAYDGFKSAVKKHSNSVEAALKLAVSGNIIDVGPNETFDIEGTIDGAMSEKFSIDDSGLMLESIKNARSILYLADNAGEIVLDRIFIETLIENQVVDSLKITAAVRGRPVQNDATMDEAVEAGLPDVVKVIDNGDGAPGTILEFASQSFRDEFEKADLIISKGQGNFETLCDIKNKNIFFLLITKCPLIAEELNVPKYTFVCKAS